MKNKIDLHTHTVASTHAFSTVKEMADEAALKGIELLGITDHGLAITDSPSRVYFKTGKRIPDYINGVRVLFGVEANIMDQNGSLDMPDDILQNLDFVVAGIHPFADGFAAMDKDGNTEAIINAMKNPYVKIISHPYNVRENFDVDIEKIAEKSCEQDVLLEINSSYFYAKQKYDLEKVHAYIKKMAAVLKKNNKKTIINSDAHIAFDIGRDQEVREKFDYLELSDEDLWNNDVEGVLKFLNIK